MWAPVHLRVFTCSPLSAELAYYFRSTPTIQLVTSGAEGTRTPYLYSAIVALSQMSYSPRSEG